MDPLVDRLAPFTTEELLDEVRRRYGFVVGVRKPYARRPECGERNADGYKCRSMMGTKGRMWRLHQTVEQCRGRLREADPDGVV